MNPEEVRFRFHSSSLKKNKIRICSIVLNCFEYENEKVKEKIYIRKKFVNGRV